MENMIYEIWKNRLFPHTGLCTTNGEKLRIIDNGQNDGESNIFNNAKIKIGNEVKTGDVILHDKEIGTDSENAILHVTIDNSTRINEKVAQVNISYPDNLKDELESFIAEKNYKPCAHVSARGEQIILHNILSRMLVERIEEKAAQIEQTYQKCEKKWEDTLFQTLVRSFGFGIHRTLFKELADILDFKALAKHRDNSIQVEAIFFGQAGLLNEQSIPYFHRESVTKNRYFKELKREYNFLSNKFKLQSMDYKVWEEGHSSPHLRIARLATIYHSRNFNMSNIAECDSIEELREIIATPLRGYWYSHSRFGGTERFGNSKMNERQTDVIIINAIAPVLYVYGKHRKDFKLCEKAEDYLHTLKSEENRIVRHWREQGIESNCAADSQALLHLDKCYCSRNECIRCLCAYYYIKSVLKNA